MHDPFATITITRLASQQLSGTSLKTAVDIGQMVWCGTGTGICPTKWGIGLRIPHLSDQPSKAK
jgi:hypothetical protein